MEKTGVINGGWAKLRTFWRLRRFIYYYHLIVWILPKLSPIKIQKGTFNFQLICRILLYCHTYCILMSYYLGYAVCEQELGSCRWRWWSLTPCLLRSSQYWLSRAEVISLFFCWIRELPSRSKTIIVWREGGSDRRLSDWSTKYIRQIWF